MLDLESLRIKILADASDLRKQTASAVADVQSATSKIAAHGADMAASIQKHCDNAAKSFEVVSQAAQKSALHVKKAAESTLSDADKMKQAMAIYNETKPTAHAGLDAQLASAHAGLESLKQTSNELAAMTEHAGAGAVKMEGLTTALDGLAALVGIVNPDLGLATVGVSRLAAVCPAAAAAVGVFAASVTATTYALQGQEGVSNILPNTMELLAMLLKSATFGMTDLTEATKIQKQAEKELAQAQQAGAEVSKKIIEERTAMTRGLVEQVQGLHDVSDAAESAFAGKYTSNLHAHGVYGNKLAGEGLRAHQEFEAERVARELAAYKNEVDAIGRTKEETLALALSRDRASEAALREFAALQKLKAFRTEQVEAEKAAKEAAKQAEEQAKHLREQQLREGESLANSLRSNSEKQADQLRHIQELYDAGAISIETYNRAQIAAMTAGEKEHKEHEHKPQSTHSHAGGGLSPYAQMLVAQRREASSIFEMAKARRAGLGTAGTKLVNLAGTGINPEAIVSIGRIVRMPTPEEIGAGHLGRVTPRGGPLEDGERPFMRDPALAMTSGYPMPHLVSEGPPAKTEGAMDKLTETLAKNNALLETNNKEMEKGDKLILVPANF